MPDSVKMLQDKSIHFMLQWFLVIDLSALLSLTSANIVSVLS